MLFSLDYDGTYNKTPELWNAFIEGAKHAGHEVVCVTMRYPDEAIDMPCEVIYTSRQAKLPYLASLGRFVSVWIDDMPNFIFNGAQP